MKKILLADDEENLRILVHTTLEDPRYEILEAADGEEALELAKAHHPDLLVLDWMMPGRSGVEVAQAPRQDPETAQTPILLLTAKSQARDRAAADAAGVNGYLVKPFSPLELMEKVEELLAGTP